jgi:alpha-glucosidase
VLLLTLRGTPTIYYGDEIGMRQVAIPSDRIRDPFQKNVPDIKVGRDGSRTPMQWDATAHAGFSAVEPWLPPAEDFPQQNVANQRVAAGSIYNLHRRLLALRRAHRALSDGSYQPILSSGDLLLFLREYGGDRLVVALNLGDAPAKLSDRNLAGKLMLSSWLDREEEKVSGALDLRPAEAVVVSVRES